MAPTTSEEMSFSISQSMGLAAGYLATACFTIQYIPQTMLNYQRKSVAGFSTAGIIIKLVGASFLMSNAYLRGEPMPVVFYGLFNVIQHSTFIYQFYLYENNSKFLRWLGFPLFSMGLGILFPFTLPFTNFVKPIGQFVSHMPQLVVTYREKSVDGVSLVTQHLNVLGGICGLYMCLVVPFRDVTTPILYLDSLFQAISIYFFAFIYDGWSFSLHRGSPLLDGKPH